MANFLLAWAVLPRLQHENRWSVFISVTFVYRTTNYYGSEILPRMAGDCLRVAGCKNCFLHSPCRGQWFAFMGEMTLLFRFVRCQARKNHGDKLNKRRRNKQTDSVRGFFCGKSTVFTFEADRLNPTLLHTNIPGIICGMGWVVLNLCRLHCHCRLREHVEFSCSQRRVFSQLG